MWYDVVGSVLMILKINSLFEFMEMLQISTIKKITKKISILGKKKEEKNPR